MSGPLKPGDRVVSDGLTGTVACNIGAGEYTAGFTKEHWDYLQVGVLVDTEEAGLVHFPDEDDLRAADDL
ncbi:MAG TPA: hypothetical protein VMF90_14115 [Rhizobiaceae bacterium]|nr:hypothetical protein [Rhizobiaceae bacterium]